ncbi:MAG: class I SAM-dependent methyltransferase [bacterium]|nr:class I SAM-dependent methyltransferase [bacterium]
MKKNGKRDWFQDWSNDYDATLGRMRRHLRMLDLVTAASGVRDGDRVLDIGCGTGLLSLRFLKAANCTVVGIDKSAGMRACFRRKIRGTALERRVEVRNGDAARLDPDLGRFDVIASTVTLHHVKNKLPMIRSIRSRLKPGGRFVIGDVDLDTTGSLADPKRLGRILDFLREEWIAAMADAGPDGFRRMYDNGKKHVFNDGEYCVSFREWTALCRKAGFTGTRVVPVAKGSRFKVLRALRK